jgi:superfamily II DNA/RNA helicase
VLVATDVAARGIHVDHVGCVVHFDLPATDKDYLHRSGRTGRAGAKGVVIAFVTPSDSGPAKTLQKALGHPISPKWGSRGITEVSPRAQIQPPAPARTHTAATAPAKRRSGPEPNPVAGPNGPAHFEVKPRPPPKQELGPIDQLVPVDRRVAALALLETQAPNNQTRDSRPRSPRSPIANLDHAGRRQTQATMPKPPASATQSRGRQSAPHPEIPTTRGSGHGRRSYASPPGSSAGS